MCSRQQQKSEIDIKLKSLQYKRRSSQLTIEEDASSCDSDDVETLHICKSHERKKFADRDSVESHLVKKLRKIKNLSAIDCRNHSLSYEVCDYISDLIKARGVKPLKYLVL